MTEQERNATLQLLASIKQGYPYAKAGAETLAVYVSAFDFYGYSYQQIRAGALKALKTAKFFPTVAEICDATEQMIAHANHDDKPDPGAAWGEVMKFIMRRGPYDDRPFPWSCEEVHEAVRRIGSTTLFDMTNDDVPTVRAQFRDIYKGVLSEKKSHKVMDMIGQKLGKDYAALALRTAGKLDMGAPKEIAGGKS